MPSDEHNTRKNNNWEGPRVIQTDIINVCQMRFASSRFISRRDNNGINTRESEITRNRAQSVLLLTARAAVSQEIKGSAVNLEHRIYTIENIAFQYAFDLYTSILIFVAFYH